MSQGDKTVQAVSEDLVVHDIRFPVPRGVATTIPGNLVCDSRDLSRLIAAKRIIELGSNPRLNNKLSTQARVEPVESHDQVISSETSEVVELRSQIQKFKSEVVTSATEITRFKGELEESRIECSKLSIEVRNLKTEVSRLQGEDSKLSLILGRLDNLPSQVMVQTISPIGSQTKDVSLGSRDVPAFIPTFPDVEEGKITPRKNTVENTGETAGDALRRFRKGKGS
jgi:hypothetical protein